MITKEEYDKLDYMQQERWLLRCWECGLKNSPFEMIGDDRTGKKYCSGLCRESHIEAIEDNE